MAVEEKCELMGFLSPQKVNVKGGKIISVTFARTEQTDDGKWIEDKDELITLKTNYIISAFGSGLTDQKSNVNNSNNNKHKICSVLVNFSD